MIPNNIKFAKVRNVKSPTRGTSKSAGLDFYIPQGIKFLTVPAHSDLLIPSGIKIDMPENYMLMGADKSGVVTSYRARVLSGLPEKKDSLLGSLIIGAKIVDEDYQGEIHIHVINTSNECIELRPGMKIAQFIFVPVTYFDIIEVPESELYEAASTRGIGGFGSTGS